MPSSPRDSLNHPWIRANRRGNGRVGVKVALGQLQQSPPPGVAIAVAFWTQEVAIRRTRIDPNQDGLAYLKDLVVRADADGGQVLTVVDLPGACDGRVDDVEDRTQCEMVIEDRGEELDDAAKGTVAGEHQSQNDLAKPGPGDGQVEQHLFLVVGPGGEGLLQGVVGDGELLVDELAAD